MTINDVELVEMPPPDMPAALYSKAVDAVIASATARGRGGFALQTHGTGFRCVRSVDDQGHQDAPGAEPKVR